jgi:hypothetical protein
MIAILLDHKAKISEYTLINICWLALLSLIVRKDFSISRIAAARNHSNIESQSQGCNHKDSVGDRSTS